MFKPWSVVDDDELKALRELAVAVGELKRGCDCEYDYRCRSCSILLNVKWKAAQITDAK